MSRSLARGVGGLLCVGLSACSSGGGGGGGGADGTASGVAVKGPVDGADVEIVALLPTGALGPVLATGTTDAMGAFDLSIADYRGWAVARVTGGRYEEEASGASVPIPVDAPLLGYVDVQEQATRTTITPLTTLSIPVLRLFAHDPEATLDDSVQNALRATANHFGLGDLALLTPADLTAGTVAAGPEADYGIVHAGLSQLADGLAVPTMTLVHALASDLADAHLDGLDFGEPVVLGAGTLSPTAGTVDLGAAITTFLGGARNQSGLTEDDTDVDDELDGSTGDFDKPILIQRLVNGYATGTDDVSALIEALAVPARPQVMIETRVLEISSQSPTELGFDIPRDLALGMHDLVFVDTDTGLRTRLRDAVEAFDADARPTITQVSPATGPLAGGTFLQVRGTNLSPATTVAVGGITAPVIASDYPRWLVAATPAASAGAVDVTVANGALEATAARAFAYVTRDARPNGALPAPTTTLVFSGFRLFPDPVSGVTAQAFDGRSTFDNADAGSFTLTDRTVSESAPALAVHARSGSSFQSTESLGKALLFFDATNGLSDFLRVFTNEESAVGAGATAFGPALVFPEPTGLAPDAAVGSWWLNGFEVDAGGGSVCQKTGWLDLADAATGSANVRSLERSFDGADAGLGAETWTLSYTLSGVGTFQGTRSVDGATASMSGRFDARTSVGFVSLDLGGTALGYYLATRVEHGLEAAGQGAWVGGQLFHSIEGEGAGGESAFESGSYRGHIAGTASGAARLAFNRTTRSTESAPDGCFSEYVGAVDLDVSPSGRVFEGDDVTGYVYSYGGVLLPAGEFPNECEFDDGFGRELAIGVATFRESRKSFLSLERDLTQVSIQAKLVEVGATPLQALGTDLFDVTADADAPPTVMGVEFPFAGTMPELAARAIVGLSKTTIRDELGGVTTTRDAPAPWSVTVGYSFIDDTLDLFATEIVDPGGRFEGASMPRWIGSGSLGNDAQMGSVRFDDEFLGDGLTFFLARRGRTLTEPNYAMVALGLAYEPGTPSGVTSSSTDLGFVGNGTVTVTQTSHTLSEDGRFTNDSGGGLGLNTAPAGQRIRLNIPNGGGPDREWETVWTLSADAFVGIDDSPTLDTAQLLIGIRPSVVGGSFIDDDRAWIGLALDPQASRATTEQLQLTPRFGTLLSGEIFGAARGATYKVEPSQSFVSTNAQDVGPGRASIPFIGQIPVIGFLFNQRDDAAGQEDLTISITPRIIASFAN